MVFLDRVDAGRHLAMAVAHLRGEDAVVLGVACGGVPVAFEVATTLDLPLDVLVVGKLDVPGQPGLVMGAVGEDRVTVADDNVIRVAGVSVEEFTAAEATARGKLERRAARLRSGRPRLSLRGRTAVVVDDGIVTGASARTACRIAKSQGAARIVLAVPVGAADPVRWLRREVADEVICLQARDNLVTIADCYADFAEISEKDVQGLLGRAATPRSSGNADPAHGETILVTTGQACLPGHLIVPPAALGVVVFAHDFGGAHNSAYEAAVAAALHRARLGTLRVDLRTPGEDFFRVGIIDVPLLARRLGEVTDWLHRRRTVEDLPIGYLGTGAGAAAALSAATRAAGDVMAVVSTGGLPHLAGPVLPSVHAATLLIVGGRDMDVLGFNRQAQHRLCCENRLAVIPSAARLLDEPGTFQTVADLACEWFTAHLPAAARRPRR